MEKNKKQKKSKKPSPKQQAYVPLTPEAERLRQKKLRGKMRKRRQRRRIAMVLVALGLIAVGIVFCLKLLFQINGVRIEIGEQPYYYVLPTIQKEPEIPHEKPYIEGETDESEPEPTQASVQSEPTEQEVLHQGAKEVYITQPIDQTTYKVADIVNLLGVQAGDNLLEADLNALQQQIEKQLPYLENVALSYKLPNTVLVKATIAQPQYAVAVENGQWAVLSQNKKVLEMQPQLPEGLIELKTGTVKTEVGMPIVFYTEPEPVDEAAILAQSNLTEEERKKELEQAKETAKTKAEETARNREQNLSQMVELLTKWKILQDVTQIDVSDELELCFWYQSRIKVKLGTKNQLEYKIQFATEILTKQLSNSDKGQLDVSHIRDDGELRPVFSRIIE